jgi:hypothetical protein
VQLQRVKGGGADVRAALAQCVQRVKGVMLLDYYAVLNVPRTSSARDLKHAYRCAPPPPPLPFPSPARHVWVPPLPPTTAASQHAGCTLLDSSHGSPSRCPREEPVPESATAMRASWVSSGSQLVCCSTAVVRFVGTTT